MSSIHRASRTSGDLMKPLDLNGQAGVIGSSPMEGFFWLASSDFVRAAFERPRHSPSVEASMTNR